MTYAEEQYRAHIERQKRLGNTVARPVPSVVAPSLMPEASPLEPVVSPAQAKVVADLQDEVAELARKLKALVREDESPLVMPSRIQPVISAVAKYYGVTIGDMVSFRRTDEIVRPRHVAMYLARQLTKHSLPRIGRALERDHTSVLHACRRIEMLRLQDPLLDGELNELVQHLTAPPPAAALPEDRKDIAGGGNE
jgi:chromosomal replication initiator protein